MFRKRLARRALAPPPFRPWSQRRPALPAAAPAAPEATPCARAAAVKRMPELLDLQLEMAISASVWCSPQGLRLQAGSARLGPPRSAVMRKPWPGTPRGAHPPFSLAGDPAEATRKSTPRVKLQDGANAIPVLMRYRLSIFSRRPRFLLAWRCGTVCAFVFTVTNTFGEEGF